MVVVHGLDDSPFRGTNATSIESDANGRFICLGGAKTLTLIESDQNVVNLQSIRTCRQKVTSVKWQRLNSCFSDHIASISGQFIDIYSVNNTGLNFLSAFRAHPLNVMDLDWSAYEYNLFITCSFNDVVNIWDMRNLQSAVMRINTIAGAEQAKWAPLSQYFLSTSHGTDIRMWDIRDLSSPFQSVFAHLQKVSCVTWHPTDPVCFVTAGMDGYIKVWNFADLKKPRRSIGVLSAPVWKLKFSFDAEEFASVPYPNYGQSLSKTALNIWKSNELDNSQSVKCEDDVILDICWQRYQSSMRSIKCLYAVSKSGKVRRYPLSPYESTSPSSKFQETATYFIEYSANDLIDEIVDEITDDVLSNIYDCSISYSSIIAKEESLSIVETKQNMVRKVFLPHHNSERETFASNKGHSSSDNLYSYSLSRDDWKIWIKAPNLRGGISDELESLRNLSVQGLNIDEINCNRTTATLTYFLDSSQRKIKFHLRFHSAFMRNHRVCLEIIENDSSLTKEQAKQLLLALSNEAAPVYFDSPPESILSRVLHKLPDIIRVLKIFRAPTIDIPSVIDRTEFSSGGSFGNEVKNVEIEDMTPLTLNINRLSPPSFHSDFDKWVPSPGACGARFNGSGFLVVFGRTGLKDGKITSDKRSSRNDADIFTYQIENISTADGNEQIQTVKNVPRSFDEYRQEFIIARSKQSTTQLSSSAKRNAQLQLADDENTFSFEADSNQNISLSFIGSNRTRGSSVTGILADHHHDLAGAPASIILVYDVSVLMSVSKELARKYVLFGNNILSVCIHNRRAANSCGRKHLIRVWKVIEMCLRFGTAKWQNYLWLNDCNTDDSDEIDSKSEGSSTSDSEEDSIEEDGPWIMHPFGRYLINNLLDYFGRINDYQTAAIIICLLSARVKRDFTIPQIKQNVSSCDALISTYHNRSHSSSAVLPELFSPISTINSIANRVESNVRALFHYHQERKSNTTTQSEIFCNSNLPTKTALHLLSRQKSVHRRSEAGMVSINKNKLAIETCVSEPADSYKTIKLSKDFSHERLIDPKIRDHLNEICQQYADLLFRWCMYSKAAEILKYNENAPVAYPFFLRKYCASCEEKFDEGYCNKCFEKLSPFLCGICQGRVKGLIFVCEYCHHGGHIEHILEWFKQNTYCPTGCGCECIVVYL